VCGVLPNWRALRQAELRAGRGTRSPDQQGDYNLFLLRCWLSIRFSDQARQDVSSNPKAPVNGMALCVKGRFGYDYVHHKDRLTKPKVRRYLLEGKAKSDIREAIFDNRNSTTESSNIGTPWDWVETNWETALEITAKKLGEARDFYGSDSIGILTSAKCLNEENYLMNKLARQVIGTNNIDHCARL
jgi:formate dehydrogenase major subunit/formate dehydrogenase alpha subunit